MRFTNCIICKEQRITSNTKDGICKHCWYKIEDGDEPTFEAYMKIDTTLEVFPRPKGRFVILHQILIFLFYNQTKTKK